MLINITNEGRYRLRSSSNGILIKYVHFKTYQTLESFMVGAPNLSNNLHLEVSEATNIDNFKKLLKSLFIQKSFSKLIAQL